MELYNSENSVCCKCGKIHKTDKKEILIGSGVLNKLPYELKKLNAKKVFLLADINTYPIAGEKIKELLSDSAISCTSYVFEDAQLEPDERAVGSAIMHYDTECDTIVALGSGVINDIGKIVANISGARYAVMATAPSMDGYASATSSMAMDALKVSLESKCAQLIIGDTDILKNAPMDMIRAGLGDMIAKYISICEWRISHIITGEYYCEEIAQSVREALKKCVDNAEKLLIRDEKAVGLVFEGLVMCGEAMQRAEMSRPASGIEHYFSHIQDMRGLEFGTKVDLHGLQCAAATMMVIKLYENLKKIAPDREKALKYVHEFDFNEWSAELKKLLGKGANTMILQEEKDKKYDCDKHKQRLEIIIENWSQILQIIDDELPDIEYLENLYQISGLPTSCFDVKSLPIVFNATRDIRDKYILSRLAWDLGIAETICEGVL